MVEPLVVLSATANPHKLNEMRQILGSALDLLPRPIDVPHVVEDQDTLVGNARLKAAAIAEFTGRPAVADDSGLFVDSLGGAPGVHSARFAGADADDAANRQLLLERLEGVAAAERTARFRTVIVLHNPSGDEIVVEGTCEGRITQAERGDRGFGYDSLFVPTEGDGRTFAEFSADDKNAVSHRSRACRALLAALGKN